MRRRARRKGASRFLIAEATTHGWELLSSDYCAEETRRNLPKLGRSAASAWKTEIAPRVQLLRASVALDKPLVLPKVKDRPVVITALAARAEWLLTPSTQPISTEDSVPRFTACASPPPASFCWSSAPAACSDFTSSLRRTGTPAVGVDRDQSAAV